jgi:hypothetical protein
MQLWNTIGFHMPIPRFKFKSWFNFVCVSFCASFIFYFIILFLEHFGVHGNEKANMRNVTSTNVLK